MCKYYTRKMITYVQMLHVSSHFRGEASNGCHRNSQFARKHLQGSEQSGIHVLSKCKVWSHVDLYLQSYTSIQINYIHMATLAFGHIRIVISSPC